MKKTASAVVTAGEPSREFLVAVLASREGDFPVRLAERMAVPGAGERVTGCAADAFFNWPHR